MDWADFLNDMNFLHVIKLLIFIGAFLFSTSYLLPRGIIYLLKWKDTKQISVLSTGITFLAGGIFILVYFLAVFIFDSIRKMS